VPDFAAGSSIVPFHLSERWRAELSNKMQAIGSSRRAANHHVPAEESMKRFASRSVSYSATRTQFIQFSPSQRNPKSNRWSPVGSARIGGKPEGEVVEQVSSGRRSIMNSDLLKRRARYLVLMRDGNLLRRLWKIRSHRRDNIRRRGAHGISTRRQAIG